MGGGWPGGGGGTQAVAAIPASGPVVLLFTDGTAGLLTGANPEAQVVVR